jgi:hypothetical protein
MWKTITIEETEFYFEMSNEIFEKYRNEKIIKRSCPISKSESKDICINFCQPSGCPQFNNDTLYLDSSVVDGNIIDDTMPGYKQFIHVIPQLLYLLDDIPHSANQFIKFIPKIVKFKFNGEYIKTLFNYSITGMFQGNIHITIIKKDANYTKYVDNELQIYIDAENTVKFDLNTIGYSNFIEDLKLIKYGIHEVNIRINPTQTFVF